MLSFEMCMLFLSALLIISEFLFIMNGSRALWIMFRWLLFILLCCVVESAGGLSVNGQDKDGLTLWIYGLTNDDGLMD